uniref:Actin n=1 Tax=Paramoeba aestuarina TaxID=180227 RepID=A0A7S4NTT1_9EUKA|mmetsp:Transcript_26490/g.41241  ORF Transcript_26490/g.41241 Transcript_26490/m.41241 type:complete len:314 (+) Transcript_26490:19-960(+)
MAIIFDRGEFMLRCGPAGESPHVQYIFSENDDESPVEKEVQLIQDMRGDENQVQVVATVPLQYGIPDLSVLCQYYFEVAGAGSVCLAHVPFLTALSFGATSAIVCDFGHSSSRITPVHDGWTFHSCSLESLQLSGANQNRLLEDIGVSGCLNLHKVKTKTAYVPRRHSISSSSSKMVLPDENLISVTDDTNMNGNLGEFFFSPNRFLSQCNALSATQLLNCGLCMIPKEVPFSNACRNVLLCGGITSTTGFVDRLQEETGQNKELYFHRHSNRHLLPWIGGTILSQLSSVSNISVSRAEYIEHGPDVILKRCF